MAQYYFSKFPVIQYGNNMVRNISERVSVVHTKLVDPNNYYPVEIQDSTRSDQLSNSIYEDSYMDWLIYLNNNLIDPYYDWHLNATDFASHLTDKYGSVEFAEEATAYYRTAWPLEETKISVSDYNYIIPKIWQKYYQPSMDDYGNISYYVQCARLDWRMNTNQIVSFSLSLSATNNGEVFAPGNVVSFTSGGNVVGGGSVVTCNNSLLVCQHITGNTSSPLGVVDIFNSNVTGTLSNTNILVTNIASDEVIFWEPVSFYDMEDEINAGRRFVSVIDPSIALQTTMAIETLLSK